MGKVSEGGVARKEEGSIEGVEPQVPLRKRGGVGGAVEEMSGGVGVGGAVGAEVIASFADTVEEGSQDF